MADVTPYYVVVDANVWIAERLMQSSIGSAFLYAVTAAKSSILLPEVVELEVARILPEMAERAINAIKRDVSLLKQLSGHTITLTAPSAFAIEEGIDERWKQLGGLLVRVPFTHDQAKSALRRVIRKAPPSGENNEQFRDCCIWDAAVSRSAERVVHLVTADNAFYENRDKTEGLSRSLRAEIAATAPNLHIHPSLRDFLNAAGSGAAIIDKTAIGDAIVKSLRDEAREIAAEDNLGPSRASFVLGKAYPPKINGYATPKQSLVAISFEASFDLDRTIVEGQTEEHDQATMTLKGVCSYDPVTKDLSEIEIREWHKDLRLASGGFWGRSSPDRRALERQYDPRGMRLIP